MKNTFEDIVKFFKKDIAYYKSAIRLEVSKEIKKILRKEMGIYKDAVTILKYLIKTEKDIDSWWGSWKEEMPLKKEINSESGVITYKIEGNKDGRSNQ